IKDAAGLPEFPTTAEIESRLMDLLASSGDAERVSALLLQILGLERGDATTEELAWASRRMLETMAQISPLIVVIDDVHWAEPALLDTIGYIADWSREASILFMCVARPELFDERSDWGGGKMNATSLLLEPLTPSESDRLMSTLLGEARLTEEVSRAVSRAAEGNPLFVEQMLEMLIDNGHLVSGADGWTLTGAVDELKIPPTIDALISARLDRLGDEERQMIERASVVGKTFSARAVRYLSPDGSKEIVLEHLMALVRKELLRPGEGGSEEGTFRFRHILIRDAAYDSTSKAQRADMHLRFAEWIRHLGSFETVGTEEILAHHLSQAHRYEKDLGTAQEQLDAIAAEAATHYESSGQRALARSDYPAAAKLLRRGSELVPDPVECGNFILPLAEVLYLQGCAEEALQHLERIRTTDDELMNARAEVVRTLILTSTGDQTEARSAQLVAERTLPLFEAADDLRWVARSWSLLTHACNLMGETSKQIEAAEKAIEFAVAAGDGHFETQARVWLGVAHSHGFTPVDEVLSFLDEQKELAAGALGFQAFLLAVQGLMKALIGKFDEARADVRKSIQMTEELGLSFLSDLRRGTLAWVETIAGEHAESCRQLQDLRERLERHGDNLYLSTNLAGVAECLCELGRYEEAEAAALHSRDISAPDDVASQAGWRGALARVLAVRGEGAEADRLLAEGAEILLTTETFYRADFSVQAAKVHTTTGEFEKARCCFAEARRDFERKGATACVANVDALVAALPGS
ncbi:MAG: ATP-binding protein, partial [Actinomycetota bacterium]